MNQAYWKRIKADLLKLSILTLLTVLIWISVETYRALTKSTIKPEVKKQLLPLTPTLDLGTMEKISLRETVPEINWSSLSATETKLLTSPAVSASPAAKLSVPVSPSPKPQPLNQPPDETEEFSFEEDDVYDDEL